MTKNIKNLLEILKEGYDHEEQEKAIKALAQMGSKARIAVPAIIKAIKEDALCWEAVNALGNIGGKEAAYALSNAMIEDLDMGVRMRAAMALAKIKEPDTIPALCKALKDIDEFVREGACYALGEIASKEAVSALRESLNDNVDFVREKAAQALEKIKEKDKDKFQKQMELKKSILEGECKECGHSEFEYDDSWDEYTCLQCGRITKTLKDTDQFSPSLETGEKLKTEEIWKGEGSIFNKIKSGYKWQDQKAFFKDYHNSLIGKRDSWTWFYGIVVPVASILRAIWEINSLSNLAIPKRIIDAFIIYEIFFVLIISIICGFFFFGKIWARKAMYWIPIGLSIIFFIIMNGKLTPDAITQFIGRIIAGSLIFLIIFYFATKTVPNKVFFRSHVSDSDIKKYWLSISNRQAFWCVIFSFLLPFLATGSFFLFQRILDIEKFSKLLQIFAITTVIIILVINIGLSIKARQKEDYNAIPPIGGKGSSYLSIIISAGWIILILFGLYRSISGH